MSMPCSVKQWRPTEFVIHTGDPIIPPLIVRDLKILDH
jgi:hypothetical protein